MDNPEEYHHGNEEKKRLLELKQSGRNPLQPRIGKAATSRKCSLEPTPKHFTLSYDAQ